jgi:putative membrane protein
MMGWYGNGWSYGWMVVMMLGWAVLIAVAVWAVVALTRRGDRADGRAAGPAPTARQVLDGRFAAGEISQQEYIDARRLLDDGTRPADRPASA